MSIGMKFIEDVTNCRCPKCGQYVAASETVSGDAAALAIGDKGKQVTSIIKIACGFCGAKTTVVTAIEA